MSPFSCSLFRTFLWYIIKIGNLFAISLNLRKMLNVKISVQENHCFMWYRKFKSKRTICIGKKHNQTFLPVYFHSAHQISSNVGCELVGICKSIIRQAYNFYIIRPCYDLALPTTLMDTVNFEIFIVEKGFKVYTQIQYQKNRLRLLRKNYEIKDALSIILSSKHSHILYIANYF